MTKISCRSPLLPALLVMVCLITVSCGKGEQSASISTENFCIKFYEKQAEYDELTANINTELFGTDSTTFPESAKSDTLRVIEIHEELSNLAPTTSMSENFSKLGSSYGVLYRIVSGETYQKQKVTNWAYVSGLETAGSARQLKVDLSTICGE